MDEKTRQCLSMIEQSVDNIKENINKLRKMGSSEKNKRLHENPLYALQTEPEDETMDFNREKEDDTTEEEEEEDQEEEVEKVKKSKRKNQTQPKRKKTNNNVPLSTKAHKEVKYTRADLVDPKEYRKNKNGSLSGWCFLKDAQGKPTEKKKFMIISNKDQSQLQMQNEKKNETKESFFNQNQNQNQNQPQQQQNNLLSTTTPILNSSNISGSEIEALRKYYAS